MSLRFFFFCGGKGQVHCEADALTPASSQDANPWINLFSFYSLSSWLLSKEQTDWGPSVTECYWSRAPMHLGFSPVITTYFCLWIWPATLGTASKTLQTGATLSERVTELASAISKVTMWHWKPIKKISPVSREPKAGGSWIWGQLRY